MPAPTRTCIAIALVIAWCLCTACSAPTPNTTANTASDSAATESATPTASSSDAENASEASADAPEEAPLAYPTGWLAVATDGIPAGTAVSVEYLPTIEIAAHRAGAAVDEAENEKLRASWGLEYEGMAVVSFEGKHVAVDPDLVLVNLPDVLDSTVFDIVYAYASTSNAAGQEIPGVTGQRIAGYADGKQENAYLNTQEYAVPCAFATAVKLRQAESMLQARGYQLLVYDAYRPMEAQRYLSERLQAAYGENAAVQTAVDGWGLDWYVAPGASGHNFGTDLDVGLCDETGAPVAMPSSFDAFDESGHLTDSPLDAGSITPDSYRAAVAQNEACTTLHEVFVNAGFAELSSEWWHFADDETEQRMRALAGDGGLDFIASI